MQKQTSLKDLFKNHPVQRPPGIKYKKQKIPVALREAVWITRCGRVFEHKCLTSWCPNTITAFDFQSGHNIPESKGGKTCVENLYPLCVSCNVSMGDRYTFDEWTAMRMTPDAKSNPPVQAKPQPRKGLSRLFGCFYKGDVKS